MEIKNFFPSVSKALVDANHWGKEIPSNTIWYPRENLIIKQMTQQSQEGQVSIYLTFLTMTML